MKAILVQAPARNLRFNVGGYFRVLPLGIAYIARNLKNNHIDFDVFFPRTVNNFFFKFEEYIRKQQKTPAVIGIYSTLFSAREALEIAKIAKSVNPKNIIVIGGPITTFSPDSIFKYSDTIDYIICAEAEKAFSMLTLALTNGAPVSSIPNIAYRNANNIIKNKEEYENNLDLLGLPLRGFFKSWAHRLHPPMGKYSPAYLVETMRGCSFKCKFCAIPHDNLRMRSISIVIEELNSLKKDFNAREVYFVDPTFTIDKTRTYELCRSIISEKINIHWSCMTRVDCVDYELLRIMKEAGCYLIHFGVESANEAILKEMNKAQSISDIISAFGHCRQVGIKTGAFLVFASTEYDTWATVKSSISLIKTIRPTYVLYDHIRPIPNGPLVRQAIEKKVITEMDLENLYLGDSKKSKLKTTTICGIPRKTAQNWVLIASLSFLLSPVSIKNILSGIQTKNDWFNLIKAGAYYIKELFRKNE
jgi:radical SAM superfamily enzyme YgiQ (UPF0313 family)